MLKNTSEVTSTKTAKTMTTATIQKMVTNDNDDYSESPTMSGEQQAIGSGVKVGHHQGNLIAGGPVVPNYDGMSVADANEAKQHYLTERKKFRDGI